MLTGRKSAVQTLVKLFILVAAHLARAIKDRLLVEPKLLIGCEHRLILGWVWTNTQIAAVGPEILKG